MPPTCRDPDADWPLCSKRHRVIGRLLELANGKRLRRGSNERDEAEFVVGRLRDWSDQGNPRSDEAVLYRSNAQSRVLEEYLINAGLPYRVYGGLRFFERAEIKDALAYLRLLSNRDDDNAFERVVNRPTRGIGARTIEAMLRISI